jgi:glutathione S-transferase|nr:glutathione transferase GstA [Kofleriaceae bacterium]
MKLYYSPGACSLAPHIALVEAQRPFDLERVDLATHRTAKGIDFHIINPKGYVPVLRLDGPESETLTEVAVILQYIADLVPGSHLAPPAGTFARYHLQSWLNFIATELHKQFGPLFAVATPPATQQVQRAKLGDRFLYLQNHLQDRAFLMGETFSVADAYLFVMMTWCERFHLDLALWPVLDAFYQRVRNRPAVQEAMSEEGLIEHRWRASKVG